MRRVFLDIETLPPDRELADPDLADDEYRRLALDGDFGRVLTVGLIVEQGSEVLHRGLLGRDRQTMRFHLDEERTLRCLWKLLSGFDTRRDLVVGHNLFDFDLPFIYKRSVVRRVRPSVDLPFVRYRSRPVFDTMQEWNRWSPRKFVSLDRLAKALGLESSKGRGIDGGKVYDKFCAGCHQEIADYCMRDVELVRRLYYRMIYADQGGADGDTSERAAGRA